MFMAGQGWFAAGAVALSGYRGSLSSAGEPL